MKCNTNMLFDYVDGVLSDDDVKLLEDHLQSCEACRETVNTFNLMEKVGDYDYQIPVDVVRSVRNSTDSDLYKKKKLLYINRHLSRNRNIRRYVAVAAIALVVTGGMMFSKNYNFTENNKKYTESGENIKNQGQDFTSTFGLPEYIVIYNHGSQSKLSKGSEKYNAIIKLLDENLKKEKNLGIINSRITEDEEKLKAEEISLEFVYFELSSYPLSTKIEIEKKPFIRLLWTVTGENNDSFELGLNSAFQAYGSGAVGKFSKDMSIEVLKIIK